VNDLVAPISSRRREEDLQNTKGRDRGEGETKDMARVLRKIFSVIFAKAVEEGDKGASYISGNFSSAPTI